MNFASGGVYIEMIDFIEEVEGGRVFWVVRGEGDDEGECEMGVGGIGELCEIEVLADCMLIGIDAP